MKKINYKHFIVECAINESVTTDNFFKYDIEIRDINDNYLFTIWKTELAKWQTEGLLSGSECDAQQAFKSLLENRKYHVQEMENIIKTF